MVTTMPPGISRVPFWVPRGRAPVIPSIPTLMKQLGVSG